MWCWARQPFSEHPKEKDPDLNLSQEMAQKMVTTDTRDEKDYTPVPKRSAGTFLFLSRHFKFGGISYFTESCGAHNKSPPCPDSLLACLLDSHYRVGRGTGLRLSWGGQGRCRVGCLGTGGVCAREGGDWWLWESSLQGPARGKSSRLRVQIYRGMGHLVPRDSFLEPFLECGKCHR